MLTLRDRGDVSRIANPHIRELLETRYRQLGTFDDGLLIVVEVGDAIEQVEELCGLPNSIYPPTWRSVERARRHIGG